MKRKSLLSFLGALGLSLAFMVLFAGCGSLGIATLQTLTITSIPEEYEGGRVDDVMAQVGEVISNGSVTVDLSYVTKEDGTADFPLSITKAGIPSVGMFFGSVKSPGTVEWSAGVPTGLLTVTDIPANFNQNDPEHIGTVTVVAGRNLAQNKQSAFLGSGESVTWTGQETVNTGWVINGSLSIPLWSHDPKISFFTGYAVYTGNDTMKILVSISNGASNFENYLFDSVQFTNGSATVSFSQGVKQE